MDNKAVAIELLKIAFNTKALPFDRIKAADKETNDQQIKVIVALYKQILSKVETDTQ